MKKYGNWKLYFFAGFAKAWRPLRENSPAIFFTQRAQKKFADESAKLTVKGQLLKKHNSKLTTKKSWLLVLAARLTGRAGAAVLSLLQNNWNLEFKKLEFKTACF